MTTLSTTGHNLSRRVGSGMNGRAVLLWPLWSPRRLGLTAVAFVAVLGILGGCAGAGHPGKPSRPAVTTPSPVTTIPAGQPTATPTPSPTPTDVPNVD